MLFVCVVVLYKFVRVGHLGKLLGTVVQQRTSSDLILYPTQVNVKQVNVKLKLS